MTDQGPLATRTELDVHGEPVELAWELEAPVQWWQRWRGQIIYRRKPTERSLFGTPWMNDQVERRSWTRRGLAEKLRRREQALLEFGARPTHFTDGTDVWPG